MWSVRVELMRKATSFDRAVGERAHRQSTPLLHRADSTRSPHHGASARLPPTSDRPVRRATQSRSKFRNAMRNLILRAANLLQGPRHIQAHITRLWLCVLHKS